jgi:hypothetical protein
MPAPWEFWFASEITGGGDVASGVSVAGQASETFAAAGAVATPSVAIAGEGAQTFAGTGAVAIGVAVAGAGAETFVGTGNVSARIAIGGTGIQTFVGSGGVAVGIAISGTATSEGAVQPVAVLPTADGVGIAVIPRPPLAEMLVAQTAKLAREDAERVAAIAAIRGRMVPVRDEPEELWLLGLITDQEWMAA